MEAHDRFSRVHIEKIKNRSAVAVETQLATCVHGERKLPRNLAGLHAGYFYNVQVFKAGRPDPLRSPAPVYGTVVLVSGTNFPLPEVAALVTMTHPAMLPTMNIGETIRNYRLQKGMSQGDIEKRTGLLRCYLSRVENGHTIPSLDTLSKIAGAMELPLSQFFAEPGHSNGSKGLPQLSDDEVRFLSQIRRYATTLNDSDRKLVLAMVKKMASNAK